MDLKTSIKLFENKQVRVEWLKEEDFGKYSQPRNHLIAELLSKTEYVEKLGTGITRIRKAMQELGLPEPIFDYNYHFAIILLDKTEGKGVEETTQITPQKILTKLETSILEVIHTNPTFSREEIARKLNISPETVKEYLVKLKDKEVLKRIGPDKGGHWEVIK